MSLGRVAARGGSVVAAGQGVKFLSQFIGTVIAARMLTPVDFGLVAMVMAIVGIAEVLRDFGLSAAAMTRADLTRQQRSNLFWTNAAIGVILGAAVWASAGAIASFYNDPRLESIATAIALVFLFNGLQTQFQADLASSHKFTALAVTEAACSLISWVIAIVWAYQTHSYWALVWQLVIFAGLRFVTRALATGWVPSLPRAGVPMRSLYQYGLSLAATQVLVYVSTNVGKVILGVVSSPRTVGLYNQSYQLVLTPISQLLPPLTPVALSTLSRAEDEQFSRLVSKAQLALGYALGACYAIVFATASPLVLTVLGAQWVDAVPFFQLFAISGAMQALNFVAHWVFLSRNLPGENLKYALCVRSVMIAAVCAAGFAWGGMGVAGAVVGCAVVAWPFSVWWIARVSPVDGPTLIRQGVRVLVAVVASASAGFATTLFLPLQGILAIVASSLVCLTVFAAFLVSPLYRSDRETLTVSVKKTLQKA